MVTEHAHLFVNPDRAADFEKAFESVAHLIRAAKGCSSLSLEREIEYPERYRLNIAWDTIEDHMDVFRTSPEFEQWREVVALFFSAAPAMSHAVSVLEL